MNYDNKILTLTQLRAQYEMDNVIMKQNFTSKFYCTIGLVIDCSNVYRYENNRDYTQKFKIIDISNQDEPVQIIIWSHLKNEFILNAKVGDILFLNKYKIDVYRGSIQLKKAYKDNESYWRLFSGNIEFYNYNAIDRKIGLDDQSGKLLTAINQLRKFSSTYFKDHKVPIFNMEQNSGKENIGKGNNKTSSDFDIILRVFNCIKMENYFKIKLTNEEVQYQLNYLHQVNPGVYKVRSVANYQWQQNHWSLAGNDYTYFLQISHWMRSYDSRQWAKLVYKPKLIKKKKTKIESIVRQDRNAQKKAEKITLRELIAKQDHSENVIVRCEVMDVLTNFQQLLKKYDNDNHSEKSFTEEKGVYIYNIHLLITDQSLNGEIMNVYIYTYDRQGLEFLPDMSPQQIYGRNILDMKEHYSNFVNRLVEESDFRDTPLDIMLSPMYNGRQTIYRIVRTELLF